jgi:glucuronoarabinoxylan endo-1,4-beta-xylanase
MHLLSLAGAFFVPGRSTDRFCREEIVPMPVTRREFVRNAAVTAALAASAPRLLAQSVNVASGALVDAGMEHQVMDGFGFSEAFHQARNLQDMPEPARTQLLDLLYDQKKGLGFSILRNIIGDGGAGQKSRNGSSGTIEPAPGAWNWKGDDDQIWLMGEAKKRGCGRFFSTAWSPPAWMKTTHEVNRGGQLAPDKYQAFADYLAEYVLGYKKHFGIDIYALSPANEPDFLAPWPSCIWSGEQLAVFLRTALIPTFHKRGVTAQIVVNEDARWMDLAINTILADPVCEKGVSIVAAHAYADDVTPYVPLAERTGVFHQALKDGKRVWQTEVSADGKNITNITDGIYWARLVHRHLVEDQVSGWLWWWGASIAGNSRGSLIGLDLKTGTYQLTKRLYTIGQYARFIRPGAHRIEATHTPATDVDFSAYRDEASGKTILVAINKGYAEQAFPVQLSGATATRCQAVRTSASENHAALPPVEVKNHRIVAVAAPRSVTTWVLA